MKPLDWLRRVFHGDASPGADASGGLESRLAEFVSTAEGANTAETAREKVGSREMIDAASRTVDMIQSTFQTYVRAHILRRFGNDFRLETPAAARTRDLDLKFGDPKTGNEYRYTSVAFKDRFEIVLRAQAMILSRDVQLKILFLDLKHDASYVRELDLSLWPSLTNVQWDQVYEKIFVEFLDWQKSSTSKGS